MTTMPARHLTASADSYAEAAGVPRVHKPRIVRTSPRRYLAINGTDAPGGPEFEHAMAALYNAGYTLKYLLQARGVDLRVGPSEGLWRRRDGRDGWSEGDEAFDSTVWTWTLLLPLVDEASVEDVEAALAVARRRRPMPALDQLFVTTLDEGLVVEAMHVGPYATEPETIAAMHGLAHGAGLRAAGPHHEIYLGDPRRTAPDRLRTVLRQPVRPAA
jgi:hypothetical protein